MGFWLMIAFFWWVFGGFLANGFVNISYFAFRLNPIALSLLLIYFGPAGMIRLATFAVYYIIGRTTKEQAN